MKNVQSHVRDIPRAASLVTLCRKNIPNIFNCNFKKDYQICPYHKTTEQLVTLPLAFLPVLLAETGSDGGGRDSVSLRLSCAGSGD